MVVKSGCTVVVKTNDRALIGAPSLLQVVLVCLVSNQSKELIAPARDGQSNCKVCERWKEKPAGEKCLARLLKGLAYH